MLHKRLALPRAITCLALVLPPAVSTVYPAKTLYLKLIYRGTPVPPHIYPQRTQDRLCTCHSTSRVNPSHITPINTRLLRLLAIDAGRLPWTRQPSIPTSRVASISHVSHTPHVHRNPYSAPWLLGVLRRTYGQTTNHVSNCIPLSSTVHLPTCIPTSIQIPYLSLTM